MLNSLSKLILAILGRLALVFVMLASVLAARGQL